MSLTSFPALEASALDSKELECEPLPSARLITIAERSSQGTGPESRSLTMSERSQEEMSGVSMLFAAGFLAKTSATLASAWGWKVRALVSGESSHALLATYGLATQSWKTSQHSIFEDLDVFSETFPKSGMTRSGMLYLLAPLEPRMSESAAGLLPTPRVSRGFTNPTLGKKRKDCLTTVLLGRPVLGMRPLPAFVEWMMGFPIGWLTRKDSATPLYLRSRK